MKPKDFNSCFSIALSVFKMRGYGYEYKTSEKQRQQMHDSYIKHREERQRKNKDYRLKHLQRYRELARKRNREWREDIRFSCLAIYSEGQPKCACCGETLIEFLTIDHTKGHGSEHRRKLFGKNVCGTRFYLWLIKNSFPEGYRVLCLNCNWTKGNWGYCPHEFHHGK